MQNLEKKEMIEKASRERCQHTCMTSDLSAKP
jgi:hypothetical protein